MSRVWVERMMFVLGGKHAGCLTYEKDMPN